MAARIRLHVGGEDAGDPVCDRYGLRRCTGKVKKAMTFVGQRQADSMQVVKKLIGA